MWWCDVRKLYAICLTALLLSACGWQLQGSRGFPDALAPVYLDLADTQSVLARELKLALQSSGVAVATERSRAHSVLRINLDEASRTVTSVSALNEPQQYGVFYRAGYVFSTVAGTQTLIPLQTISAQRTMSYDKTLALAKQREERALVESLAQELSQQILRRVTMLPAQPLLQAPAQPDVQSSADPAP